MSYDTTTRNKRSRISKFKQPFLASVLTTTSLVAGCGTYPEPPVDGSVCPTELPNDGDSCMGYDVSLTCGVPCDGAMYTCTEDGTWTPTMIACNPPPPPPIAECPPEMPALGEPCYEYEPGLTCLQTDGCGSAWGRVCGESGEWESVGTYYTCNPPMPEQDTEEATVDAGTAQE